MTPYLRPHRRAPIPQSLDPESTKTFDGGVEGSTLASDPSHTGINPSISVPPLTITQSQSTTVEGSATVSSLPTRSKPAGAIAGGVIGGLVCLAVAGGFIFCLFRRSRAARVEGHADGYEIPRPAEENNGPEYLTGGTGEVNLEKKRGLGNMTDISIPSLLGANGSFFPESASLLPLSDGRLPIPATELGAPEAHGLAIVGGPIGAPPPGESTELTAVEDNGDERVQRFPEEILQELRMLREEVQRFRFGGPTAEWLNGLPNNIPPPEYASSPDPEIRL